VKSLSELGEPDLIIIPGTKSTISDLKWMRQNGLEAGILRKAYGGTPVFGICGGFQMLGRSISDPQNAEGGGSISGMGLMDIDTVFSTEKTRTQTSGTISGLDGVFSSLNGLHFCGYEIHMGQSGEARPVLHKGNIYGSYIHGLFDEDGIADAIVKALYEKNGLPFETDHTVDIRAFRESQYDLLAKTVRDALDMELVYRILEEGL
jgi:adenosylcobyric acid synthase